MTRLALFFLAASLAAQTIVPRISPDLDRVGSASSGLAEPAGNGVVVRTGSGTTTNRTVTGTANEITVTNGDGVSGNPTLLIAPTFDISGKTSTKPVKAGTTAPATCGVGELFFDTDASAGVNLLGCTSTNTWTVLVDGTGGFTSGATDPPTCTPGTTAMFYNTTSNVMKVCSVTNTWTPLREVVGGAGILVSNSGSTSTVELDTSATNGLYARRDSGTTYAAGTQDFTLATMIMQKVAGGNPTTDGNCLWDSTNKLWKCGESGTTTRTYVTTDQTQTLTNKTLTAPTISGAITFPDNVRQTFNPGADAAGINVGCQATAPGTPANGDFYCDSDDGKVFTRTAGAWVEITAGGAPANYWTNGTGTGIGPDSFTPATTDTLRVYDDTVTTGRTLFTVKTGAGQSTNPASQWLNGSDEIMMDISPTRAGGTDTLRLGYGGALSIFSDAPTGASRVIYIYGATPEIYTVSGMQYLWSSHAVHAHSGSPDLGIKRTAAGILEINNGTPVGTTPGNAGDLLGRQIRYAERTADPSAANLTIAGANAKDVMAVYMKNDKFVIAYNAAGTVTYISIPLDGTTTTWTHSTTAP